MLKFLPGYSIWKKNQQDRGRGGVQRTDPKSGAVTETFYENDQVELNAEVIF